MLSQPRKDEPSACYTNKAMPHVQLAPSILACRFAHLQDELDEVAEADWIHIDVMDGHFVPNISFGLPVVAAVSEATSVPLDVHLMIDRPERYVSDFAQAGAHSITVHAEATAHLHRAVVSIREQGVKAGVALNPATPLEYLLPILPDLDLVLLMSVDPGFGGQRFLPSSLERVKTVRGWLDKVGSKALLQVDGGIGTAQVGALAEAGATVLVAGSSIFGAEGGARAGLIRLKEALSKVSNSTEAKERPQ